MSAQPIRCDTGNDENIAVMLVTNLQNGDVTGLCPLCAPEYLRGVAKVFDVALAPQPAADEQPAEGAVEGNGTQTRARPRKQRTQAQDVPAGADVIAQEVAASDAAAD